MRSRLLFLSVLVAVFMGLGPVVAPSLLSSLAQAETISNVVIKGTQRVEDETVLSYMQLGVGDSFSDSAIDASIKALFQTGLFRDVAVQRQGSSLVVTLLENPLINVVNFEGNDEIDDETLLKEVDVRERIIYTKARVASDTKRILELYQKQGFYNVRVAPKLIRLGENRVNLVFEITEGGKTRVSEVNFSGNTSFSDGDLRDVVATKEYSKFLFFLRNTTYDADRLAYDKELLRRHYLKNGYADARVVSADARLADNGFVIDFVVEEGPRYKIADVAVNIGDSNLEPDALRREVRTGVGDYFDAAKIDKSVEKLTLEASSQGFVFAKVEPKIDRNVGAGTLNITYDITEGQRNYVERIEIVGNTRTHDEVIRRALRLYEGDAFNRTLVERARRRLTALDFFEKIDFKEEPGSAPDKIILVIEVAEKSTGSLNFSVGYSTEETVIGQVGIQERNLFGRGQNLKLNVAASFKTQQVDLSFTEPYFMGSPVSAGFDLFAKRSSSTTTSDYVVTQQGGALRTGFRLDEYSSLNLKYLLERREISNIDVSSVTPAVIDEEGVTWKSAVTSTLTYDDLDNPNRPTNGLRAQLETEVAGLGGDAKFVSVEAHAWYFLPFFDEKVVAKIEGNVGQVLAISGDDVPFQDHFFKGADTFRGFASAGVGPKQIGNNGELQPIGGETYAIGTLEVNFPLGIPEVWGIEGSAFTDFGTVFNTSENSLANGSGGCTNSGGCTVFDKASFRMSVGAGVIWQSPFGPLRVDLAYPLLKEDFDTKEVFRFSMGTRF